MMNIRFWGVRGSIATGDLRTAGVGGNTACVEVSCQGGPPGAPGAGQLLIFDAGTGIRPLGVDLFRRGGPIEAHLFLSHFHWDHIQGLPFFGPAYVPGNRISIYGTPEGVDVRGALEGQMRSPYFPVGMDVMRATLSFHDIQPGDEINLGGVRVRTMAARHPNGCILYRVEYAGRSMVYATDTEHEEGGEPDPRIVEFARGVDVFIYDAQYTPEEYTGQVGGGAKRGWGHSTAQEGVRLARLAGVDRLVLFHHDPSHDDAEVERIEAMARAEFPSVCAAREGLQIQLTPRAVSAETNAARGG